MNIRYRTPALVAILSAVFAISLFSLQGCSGDKPSFSVEYQAVFMNNGQVYFGKMERTGSSYPLLRDVYYIGRETSPDGKEVRNILIKRGNEWHGPDYMYINAAQIALIEPVSPNSRVAMLIKEAKNQQPQPSQQK